VNTVEWIGLDFGGSNETGPIRYLGPSSSTTMRIDYDFVWRIDIPIGTRLTALTQRPPYAPKPQEHVAYAAPSDVPANYTKQLMEDVSAAGYDRHISIRYPADKGMGSEGLENSDQPVVWSGE